MQNKNKEQYITSDLKLQAFLRTMIPNSFIGINKTGSQKVNFVFRSNDMTIEFIKGYFAGEKYLLSPQIFGNYIDLGKDLIFGNI